MLDEEIKFYKLLLILKKENNNKNKQILLKINEQNNIA